MKMFPRFYWMLGAWLGLGLSALGQTDPDPAAFGTRNGGDQSLQGGAALMDLFVRGKWPMYLLAAMSIFGLAVVIYLLVVMRSNAVSPRALQREVIDKIGEGSFDEVRKACDYRPCALASVTLAAMDCMRSMPNADHTMVRDVVEGEGNRHSQRIEAQAHLLHDISVIAPMVGLLGTVLGMLTAFGAVDVRDAAAKPIQIANGVGQALVTTAFGMVVAIPAMMCYAYFRRRAASQVALLEASSTEVLTSLFSKSENL